MRTEQAKEHKGAGAVPGKGPLIVTEWPLTAGLLHPGSAAGWPGSPHFNGTAILQCREQGYPHFTDGETEARRSPGTCVCTRAPRAYAVPASHSAPDVAALGGCRPVSPGAACQGRQQLPRPEVPRGAQAACVAAAGPGAVARGPSSAPGGPAPGPAAPSPQQAGWHRLQNWIEPLRSQR